MPFRFVPQMSRGAILCGLSMVGNMNLAIAIMPMIISMATTVSVFEIPFLFSANPVQVLHKARTK